MTWTHLWENLLTKAEGGRPATAPAAGAIEYWMNTHIIASPHSHGDADLVVGSCGPGHGPAGRPAPPSGPFVISYLPF